MFEKLYSMKLPLDAERTDLYVKGIQKRADSGRIQMNKEDELNLTTYFNAFSVCKWKMYTSINTLKIELKIKGKWKILGRAFSKGINKEIFSEVGEDNFAKEISLETIDEDLIGLKIIARENDVEFLGGNYYGEFASGSDVNIGITICTFHREEYLKRNLETIEALIEENPHYNVMVIDNGSSLREEKTEHLQILHNRNYGGSGGFTRGLIEQVNQGKNDYVLLMDDDILIETSALERVYALCRHRRLGYKTQMIAGSMMSMDRPTIQYENTAYWGKIRLHSLGQNLDLTELEDLLKNEHLPGKRNKYAAWWFCCIPLNVVKKNGYPLPVFIKGDDMEYGIRNHQDIMTMNGIGVWHEAFAAKMNPVVNYYSDRNMLIINEYADGCGRGTIFVSLLGRLIRRILRGDKIGIQMLELAIYDYMSGFEKITSMRADEKMKQVQNYKGMSNILICMSIILYRTFKIALIHGRIHQKYISFRDNKLKTQSFWKKYLGLER